MNSVSVALIDSHPITIEGLKYVLRLDQNFNVVANGTTSQDAVAIAEACRPALMIFDLTEPEDLIDTVETIKIKHPSIKTMIFTGSSNIEHGVRVIEAGARGYVSKTCTTDELMRALREIISGNFYVSQNFGSSMIKSLRHPSMRKATDRPLQLSNREEQIISLLLDGKTNKEIATDLGIVERTVKHYLTILMQKLNVRNRVEVVIAAHNLKRTPKISLHIQPIGGRLA